MKKLIKSIVCALCACLFAMPAAACDGGGKPRSETLTLTVSNLGFGTVWLDALVEEFEELYDVDVNVTPTVIAKNLLTQLDSDYQLDDLCLFAGVDSVWSTMRRGKFMQIDDVWSSTVEGETQTVSDKIIPEYREAYKFNEHYYSLPFITELGGFAYNATTLNTLFGSDWSLPRTTFELDALCERIRTAGAYAFTWCNKENACYWGLPEEVWTAQYDGKDAFTNTHEAKIYDAENGEYVLDKTGEILDMKGRLRAYEVEYKYIRSSNGYSHQYCTSMQFAESQAAFAGVPYANDNKLVAFTPNGNWLYEENLEDFEYKLQDVGFVRVPVISSLSEKLSYYNETQEYNKLDSAKQAAYDAALTAVIDYVDGKTQTAPTTVGDITVSAEDVERIREARNIAYIKDQAHAFIPHNSKNPELAKKFMLFMCSDYAGEIYSSVTHGFMPTYIKVTEGNEAFLSRFDKDVAEILNTSNAKVTPDSRYGFYLSRQAAENFFTGSGMYGTPEKSYNDFYVKENRKNWQDKLRVAGLLLL